PPGPGPTPPSPPTAPKPPLPPLAVVVALLDVTPEPPELLVVGPAPVPVVACELPKMMSSSLPHATGPAEAAATITRTSHARPTEPCTHCMLNSPKKFFVEAERGAWGRRARSEAVAPKLNYGSSSVCAMSARRRCSFELAGLSAHGRLAGASGARWSS